MKNNEENGELNQFEGGQKNPFKVPDRYFEELPGKITDQINSLPDFQKTAQANPFEVPQGYFVKLPGEIADRISSGSRATSPHWITNLLRPKIALPLLVSVFVLIAGVFYFNQNNSSDPNEHPICADDIINTSYLQSMDEDMLVDFLPIQNDDAVTDSLEQYLLDNNIETSEIENAL